MFEKSEERRAKSEKERMWRSEVGGKKEGKGAERVQKGCGAQQGSTVSHAGRAIALRFSFTPPLHTHKVGPDGPATSEARNTRRQRSLGLRACNAAGSITVTVLRRHTHNRPTRQTSSTTHTRATIHHTRNHTIHHAHIFAHTSLLLSLEAIGQLALPFFVLSFYLLQTTTYMYSNRSTAQPRD